MALKEKNKYFKTLDHVLRGLYEYQSGVNPYQEIEIVYKYLNDRIQQILTSYSCRLPQNCTCMKPLTPKEFRLHERLTENLSRAYAQCRSVYSHSKTEGNFRKIVFT